MPHCAGEIQPDRHASIPLPVDTFIAAVSRECRPTPEDGPSDDHKMHSKTLRNGPFLHVICSEHGQK